MRKLTQEKGITLVALVITIIVMLILVGVTITVAMQGGLFDTARGAGKDTQIEAEKERLWTAGMGAIGTNGEIDFSKLDGNLPEGFTGSNGSYAIGDNSYIIDKHGNITVVGENTEGSIVGTYYMLTLPGSTEQYYIEFYEDGNGKIVQGADGFNFSYEYDRNNKQVVVAPIIDGQLSSDDNNFTLIYSTIKKDGSIINELMLFPGSGSEFYTKNKNAGLTPLNNTIYVNGNTTIEFGTENINGEIWGTYILKENDVPVDRWKGNYFCYSGIGHASGDLGDFSTSEDFSTITMWYGSTLEFTKQ